MLHPTKKGTHENRCTDLDAEPMTLQATIDCHVRETATPDYTNFKQLNRFTHKTHKNALLPTLIPNDENS
jgi:hypothetical protein